MSITQDKHTFSANADDCIACNRRLCRFLDPFRADGRAKTRQLARGERLTGERQECLTFWTVIRGSAAICRPFADGRRQIIEFETAGDLVCSLVADAATPRWLEALEECTICEIDLAPQADKLKDNAAFLSEILAVTHQRLELLSRRVSTLGRLDSFERVVLFLAEMSRRNSAGCDKGACTALPMSREDIADYLGLNSETVSRVMSRIKREGLVVFLSPTEYTVPDFAALEACLPVRVPERAQASFALHGLPGHIALERSG